MEFTLNNLLIFFVGGSAAAVVYRTWRDPVSNSRGWITVGLLMLALLALAFAVVPDLAGYAGALVWLVFGLVPSLGFRAADRRYFRGDYEGSRRLLRALRWLHPIENWEWREAVYRAQQLALRGEVEQARAILDAYPTGDRDLLIEGRLAYYGLSRDWTGLVAWYRASPVPAKSRMAASAHSYYLRALGHTGDLDELLRVYQQHRAALHAVPVLLQQVFLFVFAFCGRVELCRQVQASGAFAPLSHLDALTKDLWLAVAHYAAGDAAAGQRLAAPALASDDFTMRLWARQLTENPPPPAVDVLTPQSRQILERAEGDWVMFHTAGRVLA